MASPRPTRTIKVDSNPYAMIRKVIIAAVTGNVPTEHTEEALTLLIQSLQAPDDDVRAMIVSAIYELGGVRPKVIRILLNCLDDEAESVRRRAIRFLGESGTVGLCALPLMVRALHDDSVSVQLEAIAAIGNLGRDADMAIPALMSFFTHEDLRVRTIVGTSLRRIGEPALPYLVAAIKNPDPDTRERAAAILGQIGHLEDLVIETLLETTMDSDEYVRFTAREALNRLNGMDHGDLAAAS